MLSARPESSSPRRSSPGIPSKNSKTSQGISHLMDTPNQAIRSRIELCIPTALDEFDKLSFSRLVPIVRENRVNRELVGPYSDDGPRYEI